MVLNELHEGLRPPKRHVYPGPTSVSYRMDEVVIGRADGERLDNQ